MQQIGVDEVVVQPNIPVIKIIFEYRREINLKKTVYKTAYTISIAYAINMFHGLT